MPGGISSAEIERITDELNAARYEKMGQAEGESYAYTVTIIMADGSETGLHMDAYQLIRDGVRYIVADDRGVNMKIFDNMMGIGGEEL